MPTPRPEEHTMYATTADRIRQEYGVNETNGIESFTDDFGAFLETLGGTVELGDPQLARVTRLRLLTEPGYPYFDVSYCYGQLKDGTNVRVNLPEIWGGGVAISRQWKRDLIAWGRANNVFVKGLGILDDDVISILR